MELMVAAETTRGCGDGDRWSTFFGWCGLGIYYL